VVGRRGYAVQRVDGYYLYSVGSQIHPLSELRGKPAWDTSSVKATFYAEAYLPIVIAEGALEPLLIRSIFRLRTSMQAGQKLLEAIRTIKAKNPENAAEPEATLDWFDVYQLTSALTTFESILQAELALIPLYVVMPKAGYDTTTLIENGSACFPLEITVKVPEAVGDLHQGTKCIAFELNTAAGFHLHRANEAVLRKYWDIVSNGASRPTRGNMGDYLNEMKQKSYGNEIVRAALEHLVKFHRNPLIHPEQNIETADEAIALMNGIHNVIVQMLKAIPADLSAIETVGGLSMIPHH
jgi:hypothetical protein